MIEISIISVIFLMIAAVLFGWVMCMIYAVTKGLKRFAYRKAEEAIQKVKEADEIDDLRDKVRDAKFFIFFEEYLRRESPVDDALGTEDSRLSALLYEAKKVKLDELLAKYSLDLNYAIKGEHCSFDKVKILEETIVETDKSVIDISVYKEELSELIRKGYKQVAEGSVEILYKKLSSGTEDSDVYVEEQIKETLKYIDMAKKAGNDISLLKEKIREGKKNRKEIKKKIKESEKEIKKIRDNLYKKEKKTQERQRK